MRYDAAIVGAGPAGSTAAADLAARGLHVVVLDEYYRPGGRLLGQLYEDRRKPAAERLWDGAALAADLEGRCRAAGAQIVTGRTVWDIEQGWTLHVAPGPERRIEARAVILATGAIERAIPIPGWTLPGVMTIGAAQVMTNVHSVAVGERVLVVGMDALSLAITGEMIAAGVNVVGVVLPPAGPLAGALADPRRVIAGLSGAAALAPNLLLRLGGRVMGGGLSGLGARLARIDMLRAWGVPLHLRTALVEIIGEETVEAVRLAPTDASGRPASSGRTVAVDAVCISGGLSPLADLVGLAGCPTMDVPDLGGVVPVHGPALETASAGLFVAGNVLGIEGATVAAAQGHLAAMGVLRYLGASSGALAEREIEKARESVAQARASLAFHFMPRVAEGHSQVDAAWRGVLARSPSPPAAERIPPSDVIVCRCEEVTLPRVLEAFDDGATAVAGVKKRTRVCMGRCQGRVCEDVVRRIASARGRPAILRQRTRLPARPVRLADL